MIEYIEKRSRISVFERRHHSGVMGGRGARGVAIVTSLISIVLPFIFFIVRVTWYGEKNVNCSRLGGN